MISKFGTHQLVEHIPSCLETLVNIPQTLLYCSYIGCPEQHPNREQEIKNLKRQTPHKARLIFSEDLWWITTRQSLRTLYF